MTLIEPCKTEKVLIRGDGLVEKTFTMRETYGEGELSVNLMNLFESNKAVGTCQPIVLDLVKDQAGASLG